MDIEPIFLLIGLSVLIVGTLIKSLFKQYTDVVNRIIGLIVIILTLIFYILSRKHLFWGYIEIHIFLWGFIYFGIVLIIPSKTK